MEVTLTITLKADGRVFVNGPVANKIACLGLLEIAKDVVRAFDADAPAPVEECTGDLARQLLAGRNGARR